MLFRKKLQPTLQPMYLPHAVKREVAYVVASETPPGKHRVEPPHTARWVESIVREQVSTGRDGRQILRPSDRDGLPLMSDKRTFQLVAVEPLESETRVWVMLWDREAHESETWSVEARDGDSERAPRVVKAQPIALPRYVREELGETGVTLPPHTVIWQEIIIPGAVGSGEIRLQRGSGDFVNFVPSFTNSEETRH
jgi:hypothetical protein